MTEVSEYFRGTISHDFFGLCAGAKIGFGSTRQVFKSALTPNAIFKFEISEKAFQNIIEWETWQIVKDTRYAKWFAPCLDISPCGTILLQSYCRDMEEHEIPEDIPIFFSDIKKENWGIHEDNPVCRDYGHTLLIYRGFNTNKMKKADWN